MFDPTIFENLKVVLEGNIYEYDLNGHIVILNRQDLVNLATMSRSYSVTFALSHLSNYYSTLTLSADAHDLYGEILEKDDIFGCQLELFLEGPIKDVDTFPEKIVEELQVIWSNRPTIQQQVFYDLPNRELQFIKTSLNFNRKINEDHIDDISHVIGLLIQSLEIVEKIYASS